MNMENAKDILYELDACYSGFDWFSQQESTTQAWYDCERFDWLLWLLYNCDIDVESVTDRCINLIRRKCGVGNCTSFVCYGSIATLEEHKVCADLIRSFYAYESVMETIKVMFIDED